MNIFVESYLKKEISIRKLCPSAKYIIYVLDLKGPLTRRQLKNETLLPSRTIGYALKKLFELKIVRKITEQEFIDRNFKITYKTGRRIDKRNQFYQLLY